jgi:hypothetical protein
MTDDRPLLASQLREQAQACEAMGSPLYARLLRSAARDAEDGGPTWAVLRDHVKPGRGDALALRLMAAQHRLVLTGRAPALARHYPSAGGDAGMDGAWEAFREVLASQNDAVGPLVARRCQTNEVGRAAALAFGFLELGASWPLPLRVLEVGASAGLNLRFDRFRYGGGGASWGEIASPVDLTGLWAEAPEHVQARLVVVERRGCDLKPVDPTSEEGRLSLRASVWADQLPRFTRLSGALDLAARVPAVVDAASLEAWLPEQLSSHRSGVATVVYHSVVDEYLPDATRRAFHACLEEAGARATPDAPLAWLQLEPLTELRHHAVRLVTWPGRRERLVATCGAHGQDARRADDGGGPRS